jgi:histidinol dehydrogenase
MKLYKNPNRKDWQLLSARPQIEKTSLKTAVQDILKNVRDNKDAALFNYTEKFDKVRLKNLKVTEAEIQDAVSKVSEDLKNAIEIARNNIEKFHSSQKIREEIIETTAGVKCWRKEIGIEKVGLYIPGGTAPLFSTILMLGIPAKIAGCGEIVLCTPPNTNGGINAAMIYTAHLVGIKKIYKLGGAQAIAAMAYGTESVPQVYKIFGPGNQFVTKAKELIQEDGVAIDMPAGPSEVLVIADKTGNPAFIASDLLSQAEHGDDSQVILVSNNPSIISETLSEIEKQVEQLPRKVIAKNALKSSKAILLNSIDDCLDFSNLYAPEHLIIASENSSNYSGNIINAGSVFLGNYSCESAGDYASGTNHTLPTNGYARNYSGVSLESFQKKITFQELSKEGLKNIGPSIELMAEAEDLMAHKNAVSIRLKEINNV